MNARRSFFKSLLGGASAAAAVASQASAVTVRAKAIPDTGVYGTWRIAWSGYVPQPGTEVLTGHWTAKPEDWETKEGGYPWGFHGVVACTGGAIGPYHLGDMFNISMMEGSPWIVDSTSKEKKEEQRAKTFIRLMEYLNTNPGVLPVNCFRCGPIERREENLAKYGYGY